MLCIVVEHTADTRIGQFVVSGIALCFVAVLVVAVKVSVRGIVYLVGGFNYLAVVDTELRMQAPLAGCHLRQCHRRDKCQQCCQKPEYIAYHHNCVNARYYIRYNAINRR